jgi:hypothetical protein
MDCQVLPPVLFIVTLAEKLCPAFTVLGTVIPPQAEL